MSRAPDRTGSCGGLSTTPGLRAVQGTDDTGRSVGLPSVSSDVTTDQCLCWEHSAGAAGGSEQYARLCRLAYSSSFGPSGRVPPRDLGPAGNAPRRPGRIVGRPADCSGNWTEKGPWGGRGADLVAGAEDGAYASPSLASPWKAQDRCRCSSPSQRTLVIEGLRLA